MDAPICVPVPVDDRLKRKRVLSMRYCTNELELDLPALILELDVAGIGAAQVVFDSPIGFRALDERDMIEFWNTYSEPHGWLWQVSSGGWMELESSRTGFVDSSFIPELREYLVVDEMCVSVLCTRPPRVVISEL
ncbi:MAG TPA: hypothetical protein VIL17_03030 [Coriobacteriia bacterium]